MNPVNALKRVISSRFKPLAYLERVARKRTNSRVRSGPFAGQIISFVDSLHGMFMPKVLGLYEIELDSVVEAICLLAPNRILNVGAGDGYYAIGFATRLPFAKIVAFESEAAVRKNLVRNARINGVLDRIEICAGCGVAELNDAVRDGNRTTIVCDVEGHEGALLDPVAVPALKNADILVETHDFLVPDVTQLIRSRFTRSHEITVIRQQPRSSADFPWRTPLMALIPERYFSLAVSEGRPETMTWLWMRHHAQIKR